jgi:hypothetical protein
MWDAVSDERTGLSFTNAAGPRRVRDRVRVTLRLAVYRQSVRLGAEPLKTPEFFFPFEHLLS